MKLIVGLGNPGLEYAKTRHNIGFMVIDRMVSIHHLGNSRAKFNSEVFQGHIAGQKVVLLKPQTYMNLSGRCVRQALEFYKLDLENLLVVVDDTALACGRIRIRASGSYGGHNGLADIESQLSTRDYARMRLGIDPPGRISQSDYVLGRFTEPQLRLIEPAIEKACQAIECWLSEPLERVMNRFNKNESQDET